MKKCSKIVLIFLIMASILGKVSFASSKGMSAEDAMRHLRNLKGSINVLTVPKGEKDEVLVAARGNLKRFSENPRGRPILEQAFEDVKEESKQHKIADEAERIWWSNFYAIRKTYLGR